MPIKPKNIIKINPVGVTIRDRARASRAHRVRVVERGNDDDTERCDTVVVSLKRHKQGQPDHRRHQRRIRVPIADL